MLTPPLESFNIFNIVRLFVITTTAFFLNLIITYFWTKVLFTRFKPGKQRGKAVNVQISVPITFRLNN